MNSIDYKYLESGNSVKLHVLPMNQETVAYLQKECTIGGLITPIYRMDAELYSFQR